MPSGYPRSLDVSQCVFNTLLAYLLNRHRQLVYLNVSGQRGVACRVPRKLLISALTCPVINPKREVIGQVIDSTISYFNTFNFVTHFELLLT